LGRRHHPGGDGHCHPANVVVASLDLADVQPGPNPNLDAAKLVPKGDRAAAITKPRSRPALVVAPPWPRGGAIAPLESRKPPAKLFIVGAARHHARRHGTGVELGHDGGLLGANRI
jgi:hypothetical protein